MTYQTRLTDVPKLAYRDFDLNLRVSPRTGDILVKSTTESIKQAVKSLLQTNFYERPFRPYLGSNITSYLFELPSDDLEILMKREVLRVITTHENRVTDVECQVRYLIDQQTVRVKVQFLEIGTDLTSELEVFLSQVR